MADFGYCQAWPEELKELNRAHYRACCRVRNLESYIERVDPDDFYSVMAELERAREEVYATAIAFGIAKHKWTSADIQKNTEKR